MFPEAFYEDGFNKFSEFSNFRCNLTYRINKIRDTAGIFSQSSLLAFLLVQLANSYQLQIFSD